VTEVRHGVASTYKRLGCRCAPCRYAASVARAEERPLADPEPVRAHLRLLAANGIGYRRAAALAGVSQATAFRILNTDNRPTERVARLLLGVPVDARPAEKFPAAAGTRRRLRALNAAGWPTKDLAERLPADESGLAQIIGSQSAVLRRTAVAVAEVYEELQLVVPPESRATIRARCRATRRLWFAPLAWDEETIDDPTALPCLLPPVEPVDGDVELLVQHIVAGHPVKPTLNARREIVRRMAGRKPREIAPIARCTAAYVGVLRSQLEAS
jgi:hypothetical protein